MIYASFLDFLQAGRLSLAPFAVVDGERVMPRVLTTLSARAVRLSCTYDAGQPGCPGLEDELYFTRDAHGGIACRRVFRNLTGAPIRLNELGLTLSGIRLGGEPKDDYFYHNENPRVYQRMTFPIDYSRTAADASDSEYDLTAGTRWADPGVVSERIGRSPYQPFPAIHLGNYAASHGLVHGTLSQKLFYHNYLVSHEDGAVVLDIFSSFKAIEALDCADGRTLVDEWWLGATEAAGDLDRLFGGYTAALREKLPANYGATSINRDNMVWGSWNDGIHRNVTEDMLLRDAAYLKSEFPTVRWIQLDDGYAADVPPAFGLGAVYEGEAGIDHNKFPQGLRHYTDRVRALGLRPALWIGGLCAHKTKIYREHPEWFCDYSFRIPTQSPLDVSLPETRAYITHALDVLLCEYGFDAVKHDFWSYAFEDSHDLLQNKTQSGYYYRDWWLHEMRRRLPTDGYLQTGCDIVMGNPFLGEYFTNYRYGIDIGSGNWEYVKTNFLWGVACFALHTGDLIVPNSDSVGLFPGLNDTDAMFALNYCLVTRSMVEIAGKLSQADPADPRLRRLRKAACHLHNGQDVYLAGYDYRAGPAPLPSVLYFKTPQFSDLESALLPCRTAGLFNTGDAPLAVTFTPEELSLPAGTYRALDIWTHEVFCPSDGAFRFTPPPHGSRALAILPDEAPDSPQNLLEDADVSVTAIEGGVDELRVTFAHACAEAHLRFTRPVRRVWFGERGIDYVNCNNLCALALPEAGTYTFAF